MTAKRPSLIGYVPTQSLPSSQKFRGTDGLPEVALQTALNAFINVVPLPTVVISLNSGWILLQNSLFASLLGISGETVCEQITPELFSTTTDYFQFIGALLSGQSLINQKFLLKHQSGKVCEVLLSAQRVDYEGVPAALVICQEITQSVQRQHQHLEAEWQKFAALVANSNDFIAMSSVEGEILYINEAGRRLVGLDLTTTDFPRSISAYLPQDDLVHFCEVTLPTLQSTGRHEGEGKLRHLITGECFDMHRSCFAVKHPETQEVLCLATVQRNITEQKKAERSLQQRALQQAAIAKLGQQALAGTDLAMLMNEAVTLIAEILNVQLAGILELLPGGNALQLQAGVGWQQGLIGTARVGTQTTSQLGYTLMTRQPTLVEDLRIDTRFGGPPLLHNHRVVSGVSVIVPGQECPFGVLGIYTTQPQTFTQDDVHFLQAIANVLATAIEWKQSEARLRLMERAISASSNGIVITDANQPDNPIIYVNPTFEVMTGYQAKEVLGRNCRFLQSKDTNQDGIRELRLALQEHRECHVIVKNYRKDGSLLWNELRVAPVFDAEGYLTHFIGIQTDITQRKQAEDALREQEEQYRRIVETATEGIWVLNRDSQTSFVNQQMATMLGYTVDEMLNESLFSFMDEQGIAITNSNLQRRQQGLMETHDFKFRCKNGSDLWAIVSTAPFFDQQGNYAGVLGMITDITDRKQAEESLRKSEEQFRLIFELAPIGVALNTLDGHFLKVNHAFCNVLGYSADELQKLTFADITHEADLALDNALNNQLIQGEISHFQIEKRYLAKDGRVVNALLQATLVRDTDGNPLHTLAQMIDISDRKRMEKQLAHEAFHDSLTGLPNRLLFMDRLQQVIARSKRNSNDKFAVLFLDLDRFKVVNDSLGHLIGDQLLIEIAQRLTACLRPGDTVARLGGDEFTILLDSIRCLSDATMIAERIQEALKAPFNLSHHEVFTSASIGIALNEVYYTQPEELLRNADTAMYQAKGQGKSCYAVFNAEMHAQAKALLQLETDLRWAIERQEMRVFYQPIVSLKTGKITGFEALIRWHHPERGLISPAEFITVAEETGLIIPIGQWVLRESCQQLRQWQLLFPNSPNLSINVNLSSKQFSQSHLIQDIVEILYQTGLEPGSLKLEITESGIMENADSAIVLLQQLKDLNVQICIDDFGTGYSSLNRLHQFPIDMLKIDRSFVSSMSEEDENTEIVRAIIMLASSLGMEVVAEGVEAAAQSDQLKRLNCQYAQGYFFSKPLNSKAAEALLTMACSI